MDLLTSLLENSSMPWLTAILLGFMTAISPCPLATNITAIGFISKDIENRTRVFLNGLFYTLGRAVTYTSIALIIYFGADQFRFSGFFQQYGEKVIGPLLIVIGVFMLDILRLAFCPYSGILYFGMLIPITVASASGLYLPVLFAIATGIPVILFAWLLAYTVSGIGGVYNKIKVFEYWFRRVIAILFIGVGIYYIIRLL
jgi:cytochrome c-type biogenesis protein